MRLQYLPGVFPFDRDTPFSQETSLGVGAAPSTASRAFQPTKQATDKRSARGAEQNRAKNYLQRVLVRRNNRVASIAVNDVDWMRSARNYVSVYSRGEVHKTRATLMRMAQLIDPQRFLRIHRSVIVNVACVHTLFVGPQNKTSIQLHSGLHLAVSRKYRHHVRAVLSKVVNCRSDIDERCPGRS